MNAYFFFLDEGYFVRCDDDESTDDEGVPILRCNMDSDECAAELRDMLQAAVDATLYKEQTNNLLSANRGLN